VFFGLALHKRIIVNALLRLIQPKAGHQRPTQTANTPALRYFAAHAHKIISAAAFFVVKINGIGAVCRWKCTRTKAVVYAKSRHNHF
jgi:hypothetical protein